MRDAWQMPYSVYAVGEVAIAARLLGDSIDIAKGEWHAKLHSIHQDYAERYCVE